MAAAFERLDRGLRERWTQRDSTWIFDMPEGWMQGRSVFGGLTAATAVALGSRGVDTDERPLRVCHMQLMAPVEPGPLHGEATRLRDGRNMTFVEVRLAQQGSLRATANLVFARDLASKPVVEPPPAPSVPDPLSLPKLPYRAGVHPEFTQQLDMRWASGDMPFSGATEAKLVGCVRYPFPVGDAEGLLAVVDTYPTPSLALLDRFAPASTVAWTAHLLATPPATDGWFTIVYETIAGRHGHHVCQATLYAPTGPPLIQSTQLFALFP